MSKISLATYQLPPCKLAMKLNENSTIGYICSKSLLDLGHKNYATKIISIISGLLSIVSKLG